MANKANIERSQARLRLKNEQLALRVKIIENRDKLADVNRRLKQIGGRVR